MSIDSFAEGPLLRAAISIFLFGITARLVLSFVALLRAGIAGGRGWKYIASMAARTCMPFHRAVVGRPVSTILQYVFHVCLIAAPLWLEAHILFWQFSVLEVSWPALPDVWVDRMTLVVLGLAAVFFIRRIATVQGRHDSSIRDYLLISTVVMVFASGYFLAHDTVIDVPVLGRQMFLIHILSGEAMLVLTAFLFVATRLDGKKCTGCAACAIQCPTGTLASHDGAGLRVFTYSHFRCIACGSCVDACPEYAAGLRHEINPLRLFQVARAREIRAVELTACRMCGAWFTPEPQLEKIREALHDAYVSLCPGCRKIGYASTFRRLAPWTRKIRSMHDGSKVGEGAL